jgi:hypothetical protein
MSTRSPVQSQAKPTFTPVQTGILQRKCSSCGQHTFAGGECEECKKKKSFLQRRSSNQSEPSEVPPIVHEVLRSPDQSLDTDTRAFMEPRFNRDFSRVRVHTDTKAAESARAASALAYTVGRDIVFGVGQYAPQSSVGRQLLAHELTHSIQQGIETTWQPKIRLGATDDVAELEAERVAADIHLGRMSTQEISPLNISSQPSGVIRRELLYSGNILFVGSCPSCVQQEDSQQILHPQLVVGSPNDRYEQKADRVADQIMRMPEPRIQRQMVLEEEQIIQRQKFASQTDSLERQADSEVPAIVYEVLNSPGQPLDPETRSFMESRFGYNFDQVRLHTDARAAASAQEVNALAYTVNNHIVFAENQFSPQTLSGKRLLAHELTHVLQQGMVQSASVGMPNIRSAVIQREEATPVSHSEGTPAVETHPEPFSEIRPSERGRVQRIVISCTDMRLQLETATTAYIYTLEECSLPIGSYETQVTVTGNDFFLNFSTLQSHEEFSFRYRVESGQENPASLLLNQESVHVDVVDHLPISRTPEEHRPVSQCIIRLNDRELVPADSLSRNLFQPITFSQSIWSHPIPLGQFGWVEVDATASGLLQGNFSASYGPGRLTDICLMYLIDRIPTSAPIEHPLLGPGSRADVTTYNIGGRARFRLPARAAIRIIGEGRLRIAGDYLSVIEIAAAEGVLSARGEATLAGEINGAVEVRAQATRAVARLENPALPLALIIENSTIDDVNLAAEIGLRGRAGLKFRVDLSAGFDLAGFNLWRQTWNLLNFDAGVAWSGGLKYSPNPGLHWDLGTLDISDDLDRGAAEDEGLENMIFHEDSADVDEEDIIQAILNENQAQVTSPDGFSETTALPFTWYKPIELYPEEVEIPNADYPKKLKRNDGPTEVVYQSRGRTQSEYLGVADWPAQNKTFEYFPYDVRHTPEQRRFNTLLDRLGYSRSGVDAEHVWDVNLRGLEYDRFDNLWPASNQEQRLAGTRHDHQIRNYENTIGNINGRWFKIVRVRHPATP